MKIVFVGDSTVSKFNDVTYYFSRYGYGELVTKYFNNVEYINLALSGRSSRSFLTEDNYKKISQVLNKGDYLFIGFGHNDEKDDDVARFSSAALPKDNPLSIKYVLLNNYINLAKSLGATPVLLTPIVRLDNTCEYVGGAIHETKNGSYRDAILELAKEENILGIDLTTPTRDLMKSLSYSDACLEHAMAKGRRDINSNVTYDIKSVDKAHLSYYGAYNVAYFIACAIKNSNLELKNYLIDDIKKPTKDNMLVNPLYVYKDYASPDLDNYKPNNNFKTINKDYYGTAFGNLDVVPCEGGSYVAKEDLPGVFTVGEYGDSECGKINASQEGIAYLFRRVDKTKNFTISCKAKVIKTKSCKQAGFGLMLRGDSYINQDTKSETYQTNQISAGLLTTDIQTYFIFSKSSPTEITKENFYMDRFYKENEEALLYIKRLGQVISVSVTFDNKTYNKDFIDFDILSLDPKYLFVGMFATKGTLIEFSNVDFNIIGDAIEA